MNEILAATEKITQSPSCHRKGVMVVANVSEPNNYLVMFTPRDSHLGVIVTLCMFMVTIETIGVSKVLEMLKCLPLQVTCECVCAFWYFSSGVMFT